MIGALLVAVFAQAAPPAPDAQERVALVARDQQTSALQGATRAVRRAARRLVEEPDPQISEGVARLLEGDAAGGLQRFDAAVRRLGRVPRLELDRATALLGVGKPDEAAEAATSALSAAEPSVRADAHYQLGLAQEAQGKPDEAIRSYAEALALQPGDGDAKVNLELLLRGEERRKPTAGTPKESPAPPKQADKAPLKPSPGDEPKKGLRPEERGEQKGPSEGQSQAQPPQPTPGNPSPQGAPGERTVDRTEAARLLDALRASEKNLQAFRFSKEQRKEAKRSEVERDW